jgi:hypothetical protein
MKIKTKIRKKQKKIQMQKHQKKIQKKYKQMQKHKKTKRSLKKSHTPKHSPKYYVSNEFVEIRKNNKWRKAQVLSYSPISKKYKVELSETNDREILGDTPITVSMNSVRSLRNPDPGYTIDRNSMNMNTNVVNVNTTPPDMIKIPHDEWRDVIDKKFPSWINQTFIQYQTTGNSTKKNNKNKTKNKNTVASFKPYVYQKFIRDFMQEDSPYRGILLYHGLGSGKTCTSVTIAESLKKHRDIIMILPATLKANFIEKGLKFCGDPRYRDTNGNQRIKSKYTFVSYNASNKIKQLEKIGSLDNKVIIIEEVHGLISQIVNGGRDGQIIYEKLLNANNVKIIAMSGTPMINFPFEVAILTNILRGYMEVQIFAIRRASSNVDVTNLLIDMNADIRNREAKYIAGNRTINVLCSISTNNKTQFDEYTNDMKNLGQKHNIDIHLLTTRKYPLFPDDIDASGEEFDRYFIETVNPSNRESFEQLKNKEVFRRRLSGLVSYYFPVTADYPSHDVNFVELEMTPYQFSQYQLIREIEKKSEKSSALSAVKSVKAANGKKQVNSYFRIFSRQMCNFVFPEMIQRPYKKKMAEKMRIMQAKNKNNAITSAEANDLLNAENAINGDENISKMSKQYLEKVGKVLYELRNQPQLLQGTSLEKYSPKMKYIIDRIKETPGLVFIYSQFRALEGVGVMTAVLEANGYERYIPGEVDRTPDVPKYAIYSGLEDQEERQQVLNVYTDPSNKHGEHIKILLGTSAAAEGLDLKNIRQVHIMEPYWNDVKMSQVIGRAVRIRSHADLPLNERHVDIYRYMLKFTKDEKSLARETQTTDEFIYDIAKRKKGITDEILNILKEMAVDCVLNSRDNGGKVACYTYGENQEGLAYQPNIREDVVSGYQETNTKEITRKIVLGGITEQGLVIIGDPKTKQYYKATNIDKIVALPVAKIKVVKKVGVDVHEHKLYDFNALKMNNLVEVGRYNERSEVIV